MAKIVHTFRASSEEIKEIKENKKFETEYTEEIKDLFFKDDPVFVISKDIILSGDIEKIDIDECAIVYLKEITVTDKNEIERMRYKK